MGKDNILLTYFFNKLILIKENKISKLYRNYFSKVHSVSFLLFLCLSLIIVDSYAQSSLNESVTRSVNSDDSDDDDDDDDDDEYLHSNPSCSSQSIVGKIDWSEYPTANEFDWAPNGSLQNTFNNISNTGVDVTITFSGDVYALGYWNDEQTPSVNTGNGEEALQYYSYCNGADINISIDFSEPVNAVGFDLTHINFFQYRGDKYTITATTAQGNVIYPSFSTARNAAYNTNNYGEVNAFSYNECVEDEDYSGTSVGVNFSSVEKIVSINLLWEDCETCCDSGHGSGLWDIDFCLTDPTVDVVDDIKTTNEDTPVVVSIFNNDFNIPTNGILTLTDPANGIVMLDNSGTPNNPNDDVVTYIPNPNFNGTDTFDYTVCNSGTPQNCDTATVTITIKPVLDVFDDTTTTSQNSPIMVDVYSNDNDIPNQGVLTTTNPSNGIIVIDNNGTPNAPSDDIITYTPNTNFTGIDTFEYTLCNNDTPPMCKTAVVTINVSGIQDFAPVILTGNTVVVGNSGVVDFRVLIGEYGNGNSNGITPVELRITKNPKLQISFDPILTTLNGALVNNNQWVYDGSHPSLHKFIYIGNGGMFLANTAQIIGVNAVFYPTLGQKGKFPIKTTVKFFSGGETNNANNDDTDYIEYTNEN